MQQCHHAVLLPMIYGTNSPMTKPWFWCWFRSILDISLCLCCLSAALPLVVVGFPQKHRGVILGHPGGETITRPAEVRTRGVADRDQ